VAELIGHPVRTTYRTSDIESLPRADAVIVAPATYNTVNKWAAGVADNYVLNQLAELTGLGVRIVVLPFVNQALRPIGCSCAASRNCARQAYGSCSDPASSSRTRLVPVAGCSTVTRGSWRWPPPGNRGE
jgi:flavoprotein